jgi:hypothetical protein
MVHTSRRGGVSIITAVGFGTIAASTLIVHLAHGLIRCVATTVHRRIVDTTAIRDTTNAIQIAISSWIFSTTIRNNAAVGFFIPQTARLPIFLQRLGTFRTIRHGATAGLGQALQGTECGGVVGVVWKGGGTVTGHARHVTAGIHAHSSHPRTRIGTLAAATTRILQTVFAAGGIEYAVSHRRWGSWCTRNRGGGRGLGAPRTLKGTTFRKGTGTTATSTCGLIP